MAIDNILISRVQTDSVWDISPDIISNARQVYKEILKWCHHILSTFCIKQLSLPNEQCCGLMLWAVLSIDSKTHNDVDVELWEVVGF